MIVSKCNGCDREIYDRALMKIQGRIYHISCVVCTICGKVLNDKCYAHADEKDDDNETDDYANDHEMEENGNDKITDGAFLDDKIKMKSKKEFGSKTDINNKEHDVYEQENKDVNNDDNEDNTNGMFDVFNEETIHEKKNEKESQNFFEEIFENEDFLETKLNEDDGNNLICNFPKKNFKSKTPHKLKLYCNEDFNRSSRFRWFYTQKNI